MPYCEGSTRPAGASRNTKIWYSVPVKPGAFAARDRGATRLRVKQVLKDEPADGEVAANPTRIVREFRAELGGRIAFFENLTFRAGRADPELHVGD